MQLLEAVALPTDGSHDPEKCPFCPIQKVQKPKTLAKIGKHNQSSTLASRLRQIGDTESNHLFEDSVHGKYAVEAHHLICGHEILGDEQNAERFLITQNKTTTKEAPGHIENTLHDVDWDVNSARNGIWLPSVPDIYRVVDEKEPAVWWGEQEKQSGRKSLEETDKDAIAFIVMRAVGRQFHKGPHGSAAPADQSYVDLGIKELKKVTKVLEYYSEKCPMEDGDKTKRSSPPYRPPHRIAFTLDLLSDRLRRELVGQPASWKYFISKYAKSCSDWHRTNLTTPAAPKVPTS